MQSTRIFKVLSGLSIPEINRFLKFIQSPYHNVNANITGLAVYLANHIKNKGILDSKKTIWGILNIKKEFSDIKFRKLCNDLLERFEKFLIIEQLENSRLLKSNLLLEKIWEDKYSDLYEKHLTKSTRNIEREAIKSSDYYLQKYFYEKTMFKLKSNFDKHLDKKKGKSQTYKELVSSLDAFYLIEKLRLATDVETAKKMFKTDEVINLGFPISILNDFQFEEFPSVEIYKIMFDLFTKESGDTLYRSLKAKAFKNINLFAKGEQLEIVGVLVSHCIKMINKGDLDYYRETLIIYDWGIENEVILQDGKLSHASFRNYVVSGLRIGEFDMVEKFIKNNASLLDNDKKENALNFNLARVSFYRKDYNNVLAYLNKVTYEDIWYNVNSKMLLLATYYELKEEYVLEPTLDAFITYCRRDKLLGAQKKAAYYNFAKSLKKLITLHSKPKLIQLEVQVQDIHIMFNKKWLLKKIDEKINSKY